MLSRVGVELLDDVVGLPGRKAGRRAFAGPGPAHSCWRTRARSRHRGHRSPRGASGRPVWCLCPGAMQLRARAPFEAEFARVRDGGRVFLAVDVKECPDGERGVVLALVGGGDSPLVQGFEPFVGQAPEFGFGASEIEAAEGPDGKPVPLGRATFGSSTSSGRFSLSFRPVVA